MNQEESKSQAKKIKDDYAGKYVAMPSFNDRTIVASGDSPLKAIELAKKKGYNNPIIDYIPAHKIVWSY